MADLLNIFEKYPDSWRVDHPDYGDVRKTPYAKGVISEFTPISDYPLRLESQVKVEIDGIESDPIPLFYHPKSQYWDDDDSLAQAYNEVSRYFEKGFMSFQSGDEVTVMLKEGTPVAVLGFADGIPRIGENVFRISWKKWNSEAHFAHLRGRAAPGTPPRTGGWLLSPIPNNDWYEYGTMDTTPDGPDGIALGLTTEAYKLCETAWAAHNPGGSPSGAVWLETITYYHYHEYLIRLGGKLYIIQVLCDYQEVQTWDRNNGGKGSNLLSTDYSYGGGSYSILGAVDSKALVDSTKILGQAHNLLSAYNINQGNYADPSGNILVVYPGFSFQPGCFDGLYWYLNSFHSQMFPVAWMGTDVINASTIKIYVRPHSPDEGLK